MEAEKVLVERFYKDCVVALATAVDNVPFVRNVDAFYEEGAFYILTHAHSGKMQQIAINPQVALSGEWMTAQGIAESLGSFGRPENADLARRMKQLFFQWIDNGHSDLTDPNTIILRVRLTKGVLFAHNTRYDFHFEA